MAARSTNGTGISPAAPDHKEKRSTNFTARARRSSGGVLVTAGEDAAFATIEASLPGSSDPVVSAAIVASDLPSEPFESAGGTGAAAAGAVAPSVGAAPLVSMPAACSLALYCSMVPSDRKSTRLNSSHLGISYAVFCLKKKE